MPVVVWWLSSSPWAALVALLPMLGAVWAGTAGRFLTEYDWPVAESPDGLRLDHGLLDRAHETVPPGRVQSVRIVEPLLWRRRGLVRVELAVAGSNNTVLVPVASRAAAYAVIARVLPGVDLAALSFSGSPRTGSRWVVPVWWKGYGAGRLPGGVRRPARPPVPAYGDRPARQGAERPLHAGPVGPRPRRRRRPRGHRREPHGHGPAAPGGRGRGPAARPGRPLPHLPGLGPPGPLDDAEGGGGT